METSAMSTDPSSGRWRTRVHTVPRSRIAGGQLLRLEHDLHVLRELRTPACSEVLGFDLATEPCTVELRHLEGSTLETLLQTRSLSAAEALVIGRAVLSALAALHEVQLVHREVRPDRIVVGLADDGTVARAQLIHVGITDADDAAIDLRDTRLRDRLAYMSPEQAGVLPGDVGPRADLFSTGAVLHHCLGGRARLPDDDVRAILNRLAADSPRPLPAHVPRTLRAIVDRLLHRDIRARYQTAGGALADLGHFQQALDEGDPDPTFPLGSGDPRAVLGEPVLCGRDVELQTVMGALDHAISHGRPHVLVIEAPSGAGKTRLMEEAGLRARARDVIVLTARGKRSEARQPFQVLRQLVRTLVAGAADNIVLRRRIDEQARAHGPALTVILPDTAAHDPQGLVGGEESVVFAVRSLFEAIAAEQPLVLLLDDCQWADAATLRLLHQPPREDLSVHLFIVATFRIDDDPTVHTVLDALDELAHVSRLPLRELDRRALWNALTSMAGTLPSAVETLLEATEFSPFTAVEMLRGLVETGALEHRSGAWTWREGSDPAVSVRAASMLVDRLDALPAETLDALRACAVVGRTFDLDAARMAVDLPPAALLTALDDARRRALLWTDASGTRFTFPHDMVRESLIDQLSTQQRATLHLRLARSFEHAPPDRGYTLAYHFHRGGQPALAFPHAVAAAEDARARSALDLAEENYRIALEGLGSADRTARKPIIEGFAQVLLWRGAYGEAEKYWMHLLAEADDAVEQAAIIGQLADLYNKNGNIPKARERLLEGLAILGYRAPVSLFGNLYAFAREFFIHLKHCLRPEVYLSRLSPDEARPHLLAAQMLETLTQVSVAEADIGRILWTRIAALNGVEMCPPCPDLGLAWIHYANLLIQIPLFRRAERYTHQGLKLLESQGSHLQLQCGLARRAYLELSQGRLADSVRTSWRAQSIGARSSDNWEVQANRMYHARALFLTGDTRRAARMARGVWQGLERGGEIVWAYYSLSDLTWYTGGQISASDLEVHARSNTAIIRTEAEFVRGLHALGAGEAERAARCFERSLKISGGQEALSEYVKRFCWVATAWRLALAQIPAGNGRVRAEIGRNFRRAARAADGISRRSPTLLPHALREHALAAAEAGRTYTARRRFRDALKLAVEQENWYNFAWTLYERGRVGRALGWPGADENLADARWVFQRLGLDWRPVDEWRIPTLVEADPAPSVGLADRFLGTIEAGRQIVSSRSVKHILAATRSAALSLLRPQQCAVTASPSTAAARSFISVPIVANGRTCAFIEATHEDIEGYFGSEEHLILTYLAALAGAAVEIAERFSSATTMSSELAQHGAKLRAAHDEKEVMMHEIHHRVKNNLQVILSLLSMQSNQSAHQEIAAEFLEMANRIRCLATIHEFIYAHERLSLIPIAKFVHTLVEHLAVNRGRPPVTVTCAADAAALPLSTAVDCGLVLHELLSNARHRATPDSGPLDVHLQREADGTVCLEVSSDRAPHGLQEDHSLGLIRALSSRLASLSIHDDERKRVQVRFQPLTQSIV